MQIDLVEFFTNPTSNRQKQYEAVRAVVIDKLAVDVVAKKFGYQVSTIYSLVRNARSGKLKLFPEVAKGKTLKAANTIFDQDLRRFESHLAPSIFKRFINMPGRVVYDGENFVIKIRKRAHTPILKGVEKLNEPIHVPWLNNKSVKIEWTP